MGPARDEADEETGAVLSADELDIERSDNVVALDEGRYVIGSHGEPSVPDRPVLDSASETTTETVSPSTFSSTSQSGESEEANGRTQPDSRIDSREVHRWLEDDLDDVDSRYGFHISAKSEGAISHQRMFSDDVGTVFDSLLSLSSTVSPSPRLLPPIAPAFIEMVNRSS